MRCGAKCFIVEMEKNGRMKREFVTARTPAGARKLIRGAYGRETIIASVREGTRNN